MVTWTPSNVLSWHMPQEPHTNWDRTFLCILPYLNISDFSCWLKVYSLYTLHHYNSLSYVYGTRCAIIIDMVNERSHKWLLKSNPDKCKLLQLDSSIPTNNYLHNPNECSRSVISRVTEEKDLGIWYTSKMHGVQLTAGLGFFLHSSHLVYTEDSEDSDSLLYRLRPFLQVPSGIV